MWTTFTYTNYMEDKFSDLGVDAIVGGDLMYKVGITEWDLRDPSKFEKMKDIISYLKEIPPEERGVVFNRVLMGKNVDKLDHMFGYVSISRKFNEAKKNMDLLREELSYYER